MTANQPVGIDHEVNLPAGYMMRPAAMNDLSTVVEMLNIWSLDMYGREEFEEDDLEQEWTTPEFSLQNSTRLIHTLENRLVGYIEIWDIGDSPVRPWVWARVHPSFKGNGIGTALMQWVEQRARQAIERCAPDVRVSFWVACQTGDRASEQLFEDLGFQELRNSYEMLIVMDEPPPAPVFPPGISVRTYQHPDEFEAAVQMNQDAFRDHFGYVERPIEDSLKRWRHWIESDKEFDASLWFLAIDDTTQGIVGFAFCRRKSWEDPDTAYLESVGVRRPYRKQGLGLALLHHSFGEFWRRGQNRVGLGVDAGNLTGAVRLYERAGMHIYRQQTNYEKELRPGREISITH